MNSRYNNIIHRNTKKMLRVTVIDIGCLLSWKMILLIKCIFFYLHISWSRYFNSISSRNIIYMYICVYYYMSVRTILCFYTRLKNTPTQCNTIFHTGCTPIYILYEIDVHYIYLYIYFVINSSILQVTRYMHV